MKILSVEERSSFIGFLKGLLFATFFYGFSLNSLIEKTRQNLISEEDHNFFNEKLKLYGFFDSDSELYNRMYSLKNIFTMSVTDEFPKIIKSQLPLGVYEISYSIEISAVENFIVKTEKIISNL
jgi:hypothetical protein